MIDRDIILDLLPLYRAGLGSPATRALVAAYLAEHPELAADTERAPEDTQWRASLARARRVARTRRYLFALAVTLTALTFALRISFAGARPSGIHLLALDAPLLFVPLALAALGSWIAYWRITRRGAGQ